MTSDQSSVSTPASGALSHAGSSVSTSQSPSLFDAIAPCSSEIGRASATSGVPLGLIEGLFLGKGRKRGSLRRLGLANPLRDRPTGGLFGLLGPGRGLRRALLDLAGRGRRLAHLRGGHVAGLLAFHLVHRRQGHGLDADVAGRFAGDLLLRHLGHFRGIGQGQIVMAHLGGVGIGHHVVQHGDRLVPLAAERQGEAQVVGNRDIVGLDRQGLAIVELGHLVIVLLVVDHADHVVDPRVVRGHLQGRHQGLHGAVAVVDVEIELAQKVVGIGVVRMGLQDPLIGLGRLLVSPHGLQVLGHQRQGQRIGGIDLMGPRAEAHGQGVVAGGRHLLAVADQAIHARALALRRVGAIDVHALLRHGNTRTTRQDGERQYGSC